MTTFYLLLCCVDYVHRRFLSQQPTGEHSIAHVSILVHTTPSAKVNYNVIMLLCKGTRGVEAEIKVAEWDQMVLGWDASGGMGDQRPRGSF